MVQVRQKPAMADGQVNIPAWLEGILAHIACTETERQALQKACERAQQVEQAQHHVGMTSAHSWGSVDSFQAGLEMAQILAELHLDPDTLQAAILYRTVREDKLALSQVEKEFGPRVAHLIEGVLRMAAIGSLRKMNEQTVLGQSSAEQIEHLRKMLVALIDDVRVALIKIAERTCAIRAVKNAPEEKRRRVAREVKDIYAPLAHRLGIGQIRWELEDLAFRYLEPQAYQQIAALLDEKRLQREKYLEEVIAQLQAELAQSGITAQLKGRVKHIYSIWRKMKEKGIPFSQVYDVRAVRVLVNTVHECYMVLGVVHGLWRAIPNEFDDYIANPKENGYRSLHTAVIGPGGKVMEVQIRTHWMHEEAEFGVCAHWQYKNRLEEAGKRPAAADYEQKVEWLRQVLEWHEETGGDRSLIEELRSDVVLEKIYVFTPGGDVVELQQGATALDFAYHIHTGLGHRCRGARVNGKVVPLHQALKNSDQVEIIAGKHEVPNREWLSTSLGYVHTTRARSKIHQWFRQQDREQHISNGSIVLDQEFKRLALADLDRSRLARELKFGNVEALHAAIGAGDIDMTAVLQAAQQMEGVQPVSQQLSFMPSVNTAAAIQPIIGVGNMAVELANCCVPDHRYAISGQMVGPQRVRIHRQDCEQLLQALSDKPETIIRVSWGTASAYALEAELELLAYERTGLLRDITEKLDQEGANILRLHCVTDKLNNKVTTTLLIEIANLQKLSVLLARLNQVPNLFSVRRL